ncbi:hypothetical protein [Mycobacteroides abscessus]|uniref:hypothetical protein n=1 Tax=Mycobacteroides abscessus TaxID=36809 RepID=UPI0005E84082|nr:hypothetical protein [Mycobacteroides abscessus]CPW52993.1 Uncharacterised protein [Mycobacteroides abscessus]SKF44040.1 Uncharacterised protein [Mycobacteroides abscessus subsp. bolletii]SKH16633.1 Uncharacterised protein [Mycobacteroides abscessus subsp. bolletii]
MSHLIRKADEEFRLYLAGEGADCSAYAEHVSGAGDSEGWRVCPNGIAEHLEDFVVKSEKEAFAVLEVIGHAYEAGGGGDV